MNIKIRKATQEDALFLAQMILQSTRAGKKIGIFDIVFEEMQEEAILKCLGKLTQTQTKNYCHFSNFLIASVDGEDVGTLCTYEPRIMTKETFAQALEEVGCSVDVEEKLEVLYSCSFEINNRILMFDFLQVTKGYDNVEVLKALMQKSLLTARLKGYRIVKSIVEIGALDCKLTYEKLGFKEKSIKECESYKEVFGRAGLILMYMEF